MNPKGIDFTDIQSGNWNVAKPWTIDKIHKWSVLIDDYQTLSTFGTSDIYGDIFNRDLNLKNTSRISSFRRLIHAIGTLLRNTRFAIKGKEKRDFVPDNCQADNDKSNVDFKKLFFFYKKRLDKIESNIDRLRLEKKRGSALVELNLNEDLFKKMMDEITDIIDDINYILNYNNLIFTHIEEFDPKKAKDKLREKFINKE